VQDIEREFSGPPITDNEFDRAFTTGKAHWGPLEVVGYSRSRIRRSLRTICRHVPVPEGDPNGHMCAGLDRAEQEG